MNALEELNHRASIAAFRQASTDPALRETGERDEKELLEITQGMDEHPEQYEGPCFCAACRAYMEPNNEPS